MDSFDFTFLIEILRLIILLALKKKKKKTVKYHMGKISLFGTVGN